MKKRILAGNAIILSGMLFAIIMTFVYTWITHKYPKNEARFTWIFSIGGGILALVAVVSALIAYTNNFGEGLKDKP